MVSDLELRPDFTSEWNAASSDVPRDPLMAGDIEDQVRAIALSLKPTRRYGQVVAAGVAGIVLAGLHSRGWDVVRREPEPCTTCCEDCNEGRPCEECRKDGLSG